MSLGPEGQLGRLLSGDTPGGPFASVDGRPVLSKDKQERRMKLKLLVVPFLVVSLAVDHQYHTAHSLYVGTPTLVGWSAAAMSVTATACMTVGLHAYGNSYIGHPN